MAYAVLADYSSQLSREKLAELCDDSGQGLFAEDPEHDEDQAAAAAAARAVAQGALDRASAKADGFFGVRKSVPLDSPQAFVRSLVVDLAVYDLCTRRNLDGASDGRKDRNDAAMKLLEAISVGKVSLGGEPDAPIHKEADLRGELDDTDRTFDRTVLEDF